MRPSGAPDAHAWGARARMRSEWAIEKRMGNRRGRAREVVREEGEIIGKTAVSIWQNASSPNYEYIDRTPTSLKKKCGKLNFVPSVAPGVVAALARETVSRSSTPGPLAETSG